MKYTVLLVASLLAMIGCSKKGEEQSVKNKPEDPVVGFFSALEARDSAKAASFISSDLLASTQAKGDSVMRMYFVMPKNEHIKVQVVRVSQDSVTKSLAKVYVTETYTRDTITRTWDSIYFYSQNEGGVWKLSSFLAQKDIRN